MKTARWLVLGIAVTLLAACSGPQGPEGPQGQQGLQGIQGVKGDKGDPGDPLAAVLPVPVYDGDTHQMNTVNMSVAQAICLARHGIWDSGTSTCGNPLAYGTANVPRTDSDGAAVASCPAGFTPADCATAFFLLQFWRLSPELEAPNGHAWCSGGMNEQLNTGSAPTIMPMFWATAPNQAPAVCAAGNALVIDMMTPARFQSIFSRPSYPRPHLYCQPTNQTNPWMCISTRLP